MNNRELANFKWSTADLLKGEYKQAEYGNGKYAEEDNKWLKTCPRQVI